MSSRVHRRLLYSYGVYSYGVYSDGVYRHGLHSYGAPSHDRVCVHACKRTRACLRAQQSRSSGCDVSSFLFFFHILSILVPGLTPSCDVGVIFQIWD